jgi:hypothetical protein
MAGRADAHCDRVTAYSALTRFLRLRGERDAAKKTNPPHPLHRETLLPPDHSQPICSFYPIAISVLMRIKAELVRPYFYSGVIGREDGMSVVRGLLVAVAFWAAPALAADAERGKDIAERQCAACHQVALHQRNELADAPPFELIGRKNGFDAATLAFALLGPHPKMNFSPTQRDAADVAAYISTLSR